MVGSHGLVIVLGHNGYMTDTLTLSNDHWRVRLNPRSGGTVLEGLTRLGDDWVHLLRPTPGDHESSPPDTASYPLIPWSNRIRDGLLVWQGSTHRMRINFPDGTAIHGTGMEFPWEVVEVSPTHAVLTLDSREFVGVNFPWDFTARLTYTLDGTSWVWGMAVTNVDKEPFPMGVGHHPYFMRHLIDTNGESHGGDVELQTHVERGYDLVDCMPTSGAGDVPQHADFRTSRPLGTEFVDDCFTGRTSDTIATLTYPDALVLEIGADPILEHLVVYIPNNEDFLAVEPVSNANDGFNLMAQGIDGHGVVVLAPGETFEASFTLTATATN